ncbi:hypothetical protein HYW67_01615 [Candidatus Parcubacteria bacterium]|nr:hypothetical protein [Candidatus Parcubacteria bacterium]
MNHFERPSADEFSPTPETPVPTPEMPSDAIPEQRAETAEQIIEQASSGRRALLKDIFTSRAADLIGNFLPGVDVPKMIGEAIAGKTVSGEGLSRRKRLDHMAIAGGITLAYALGLAGLPAEASVARTAASILAKIELGPEFLAETAHMAASRFPKTSHLLERTASFVGHKRDLLTAIGTEVRAAFEKYAPQAAL